MKVKEIHHVAVKAWNVTALAEFYVTVFGMAQERSFHDEYGLRSVWLTFGSTRMMVERSEEGGVTNRSFSEDPTGLHLIAFSILPEERALWREHLGRKGCEIAHETEHTLYVQDPEGNRIGLSSWSAPVGL